MTLANPKFEAETIADVDPGFHVDVIPGTEPGYDETREPVTSAHAVRVAAFDGYGHLSHLPGRGSRNRQISGCLPMSEGRHGRA